MLNPGITAAAVVALCLLQVLAAWALCVNRRPVAAWVALFCPLAVLTICIGRMSFDDPLPALSALRPLEQAFLAVNLALAVVAAGLLLRGVTGSGAAARTAGASDWSLWAFNTATCAAMVYLAFFFRLF